MRTDVQANLERAALASVFHNQLYVALIKADQAEHPDAHNWTVPMQTRLTRNPGSPIVRIDFRNVR